MCHPDQQGAPSGHVCTSELLKRSGQCSPTALGSSEQRLQSLYPMATLLVSVWVNNPHAAQLHKIVSAVFFSQKKCHPATTEQSSQFPEHQQYRHKSQPYLKIGTEREDISLSQMNLPFVRRVSVRCFAWYRLGSLFKPSSGSDQTLNDLSQMFRRSLSLPELPSFTTGR